MSNYRNMTAADIMVRKVITLRPHMEIMDAVRIMNKHKIAGAPVVDEAIGTKWDIKDRSARSFSNDFYTALNEQATVREAFEKSADEDGPYIRRPVRDPDPSIKLPPADPSGEAKIEGLGDRCGRLEGGLAGCLSRQVDQFIVGESTCASDYQDNKNDPGCLSG